MTPDTRGDGVEAVAWRRAVEPLNKYMDGWEVTTQPGYSTSWEPLYPASALTRERAAGFAEGVAEGRKSMTPALASLAAAISLLEHTPKAKKAAPSDRMFDQMLTDYRASLDYARSLIQPQDKQETRDGE